MQDFNVKIEDLIFERNGGHGRFSDTALKLLIVCSWLTAVPDRPEQCCSR